VLNLPWPHATYGRKGQQGLTAMSSAKLMSVTTEAEGRPSPS